MALKFDSLLAAIDRDTLGSVVERAHGLKVITTWYVEKFRGGTMGGVGDLSQETAGVARFAGKGQRDGQETDWSVILKVLPPSVDTPDKQEATREWDAYQSMWLRDLSGGLVAPRLLGLLEQPDSARGLWLEDITEEGDPVWPLTRYALAARHLGLFNGKFTAPERLPTAPWLGKQWLRGRMIRRIPMAALLRESLDHPLVRRLYRGHGVDLAFRLWAEHGELLDRLDRLPQTLCHQDAFRRNLIARHDPANGDQTVAIDWAFMGLAAVGAEIAPLVWVSGIFQEIQPEQIPELDEMVFSSYLGGLRDAEWHGDVRAVRFAYLVTGLLNLSIPTEFLSFMDEGKHAALEQAFGYTIGEIIDNWAKLLTVAEPFADELRGLTF